MSLVALGGDEAHKVFFGHCSNPEAMTYTLETWIAEAYRFYRPLGFFNHYQGEPDAVCRALQQQLLGISNETITPEELLSPEFDLFFLSLDPSRSLYSVMDFGDYLAPGNDAYVASLEALAAISRGVFQPVGVKESWDTPEGPIRISFELDGKKRELTVDTWGGTFDFRILLQLNAILANTEYRFEMAPLDEILFVTVLKAEERARLEMQRDLAFMVLSLPRVFYPLHHLGQPLELPADPEKRVFYSGTLNENLDRCVGRLRFILAGDGIEGHHQFSGTTHSEDLSFDGILDRATSKAEGTLEGYITVDGEMLEYEGTWEGEWYPGNRVATGRWEGWFCRDCGEDDEKPIDDKKIYRGQLGLLEEEFLHTRHHYLDRVRSWLGSVWESSSNDDYPWLLPVEEP